jgi:hypothetical protein
MVLHREKMKDPVKGRLWRNISVFSASVSDQLLMLAQLGGRLALPFPKTELPPSFIVIVSAWWVLATRCFEGAGVSLCRCPYAERGRRPPCSKHCWTSSTFEEWDRDYHFLFQSNLPRITFRTSRELLTPAKLVDKYALKRLRTRFVHWRGGGAFAMAQQLTFAPISGCTFPGRFWSFQVDFLRHRRV